ncbi:G-protein coupled receptors family 1 profile domain-containing protein [Caenorhabditis elegans]|uniref:G-protein coupled receptors family 1 profile domain-containing protein n=1 Tax=Caenorhabditis elegans TaxID=6239 RepID=Q20275_CAEEL|nr:G-protein coupled receptors family 1 profile domain-containing protein [Caenorhabditis elegans]CAA92126.2 G-protein coupled receptors family 1 profile domain-containing protein [Caenorhabditis elegans]|eukprot:NP_509725.2 NeuroPeptide Receptor family [Caenorhabditis elegans]
MSNDLVPSVSSILNETTPSYQSTCKIKNNPMEMEYFRPFFISMYCAVFLVASSGNFLVVYVVMTNKRMQTITNIFITNLAVSDIMVNFTSLWLTPTYTSIGHWIFGGGLCHGLPLFQGTSIFISTWTLTAIAIDRYIVIVHNSSNININDRMSMRSCLSFIVLIWLCSLLLVTPYAINMKLNYIHEPCDFLICSEDWSNAEFRSIFGIVVMILQFILPFVLIAISYIKIWLFLNSRQSMTERKSDIKRKKRLLRMLIVMVVIFAICWFPFNLLNCLRDLKLDNFMRGYFSFVFLSVHLMSMTATAWNPILYAFMNETFREEFAKVVPCLFARRPGTGPIRVITERTAMITNPFRRANRKKKVEEQPVTVISESPLQTAVEPQRSIVYLDEPENGSSCQTLLL